MPKRNLVWNFAHSARINVQFKILYNKNFAYRFKIQIVFIGTASLIIIGSKEAFEKIVL